MFSQATTFDLVLPRILAGEPGGATELAALGHGGPPVARQRLPLPALPQERRARGAVGVTMALYSNVIRDRFRRPRYRGTLRAAGRHRERT